MKVGKKNPKEIMKTVEAMLKESKKELAKAEENK